MKGFIYLIEVAVAAILITVALTTFFGAQNIKADWARPDLIEHASDVFKILNTEEEIQGMVDGSFDVQKILPANIRYNVKVSGTPRDYIRVAVSSGNVDSLDRTLTDTIVNSRTIKFIVSPINYALLETEAIILTNSNDFINNKDTLVDYKQDGGVIVFVGDPGIYTSDFAEFFGLSDSGFGGGNSGFYDYFASNKIEKYFRGSGFTVETPTPDGSYYSGPWKIKGNNYKVATDGIGAYINEEGPFHEGDEFRVSEEDFIIKKISGFDYVAIRTVSTDYEFTGFDTSDFEASTEAENIVGDKHASYLINNGNAVWLSGGNGNDHDNLLTSILLAKVDNWYVKDTITGKRSATFSRLVSFGPDVNEVVELTLIVWYPF